MQVNFYHAQLHVIKCICSGHRVTRTQIKMADVNRISVPGCEDGELCDSV